MHLGVIETLLLCCAALLLGRLLLKKIHFLEKYSIPEPIIGGVLVAIILTLLLQVTPMNVTMDMSMRSPLLLMFFCTIGLTADLRLLRAGGKRFIWFIVALFPFLIIQNLVGLGLAKTLDMHPIMGLLGGTITLVGGHGTGSVYAGRFAEVYNLDNVFELAMTAATVGLILGGLVAGPVAQRLIKKYQLVAHTATAQADGQAVATQTEDSFHLYQLFYALFLVLGAFVLGNYLASITENPVVSLPAFLWCLLIGVVLRNTLQIWHFAPHTRATEMIGGFALSVFLGMQMMSLELMTIIRMAGPITIILLVQMFACALYAMWVTFRLQGKDYEGAVLSAAFCGFAMGTTATAVANMQAIIQRSGPAPQAMVVVPLTGAFLVDIMNVVVLTVMIDLPFIGGF